MTSEKAKVRYTAKTHTTGGRAGASRSDDGRLDICKNVAGDAEMEKKIAGVQKLHESQLPTHRAAFN
jgi:organic hydroperoxide reductase OsmC/OhrA